jgi:hypothetical protein
MPPTTRSQTGCSSSQPNPALTRKESHPARRQKTTARARVDDSEPTTRKGRKCRPLPLEIVWEIVEFASSRQIWGAKSPVEWLKALALVSKDWCAATQPVLFSSFTFGQLYQRKTHPRLQEQISRLEVLESCPNLAKYVCHCASFPPTSRRRK